MIIVFGGEKGGTGKTTISVNVAAFLANKNIDCLLVDADPQGSASRFIESRNENQSLATINCVSKTGNIAKTLQELSTRYPIIIVDVAGYDSPALRSSMVVADKLYVPCRASRPDLETLPHVEELVTLSKALNPELEAFILLNQVPTNPQVRELAEAQALVADFEEMKLADSMLADRIVYRHAFAESKGVVEMENGNAKAEIELLCAEIFGDILDAPEFQKREAELQITEQVA